MRVFRCSDAFGVRAAPGPNGCHGLQGLATKVRRAVTAPPRVAGAAAERGAAAQAIEKYALVKDALRFTTRTNDAFPAFGEDQLVGLVRAMVKQEFFVGQHLATQVTRGAGRAGGVRKGRVVRDVGWVTGDEG